MLKDGIRIIGIAVCALCLFAASAAYAETDHTGDTDGQLLALAGDPVLESDGPGEELMLAQVGGAETNEETGVAEPVKVADEAEPEDTGKWWNLTFTYELSHNFAAERPTVGNAFGINPGFVLPENVMLGLHFGFWVTTEYPSDVNGGRDVTVNTVDADPLSLSISRTFVIDPDYTGFSITPSVLQLFPETSKFAFQVNEWYYAIKPGVRFGISKWGLSLSYGISVQKNFHGQSYVWTNSTSTGTPEPTPLNEWTLSQNGSLRYSIEWFSIGAGVGWSRSWRYVASRQELPSNVIMYSGDIGFDVYEGLNITLGITTAGPERRYGGFKNDYTLPLDPQFTTAFLSIAYSI